MKFLHPFFTFKMMNPVSIRRMFDFGLREARRHVNDIYAKYETMLHNGLSQNVIIDCNNYARATSEDVEDLSIRFNNAMIDKNMERINECFTKLIKANEDLCYVEWISKQPLGMKDYPLDPKYISKRWRYHGMKV